MAVLNSPSSSPHLLISLSPHLLISLSLQVLRSGSSWSLSTPERACETSIYVGYMELITKVRVPLADAKPLSMPVACSGGIDFMGGAGCLLAFSPIFLFPLDFLNFRISRRSISLFPLFLNFRGGAFHIHREPVFHLLDRRRCVQGGVREKPGELWLFGSKRDCAGHFNGIHAILTPL